MLLYSSMICLRSCKGVEVFQVLLQHCVCNINAKCRDACNLTPTYVMIFLLSSPSSQNPGYVAALCAQCDCDGGPRLGEVKIGELFGGGLQCGPGIRVSFQCSYRRIGRKAASLPRRPG